MTAVLRAGRRRPRARPGRVPVVAAVIAAVALLVGACAQAIPGTAVPDTAGSAPPGLETFYAQRLDWGPCGDIAPTDEDRAI
jgi:hypothetical protein